MNLSVTHYSGDRIGGAARAALRLHAALRKNRIDSSRMIVAEKTNDDWSICGLNEGIFGQLGSIFKSSVDALPRQLTLFPDRMPRSAGWASRLTARKVDADTSDIAHLHWINGALLSVEQIGKISKPLVWTLHDMWAFCGAEHLAPDGPDARWRNHYTASSGITGFDLDRWVWQRKRRCWNRKFEIVTPSRWLADCVRQSSLFHDFPVHVIPNILDVEVFKPMNKAEARRLLNLPQNRKIILFGAINGTKFPHKGWDLLMPALENVVREVSTVDAVIFGQSQPQVSPTLQLNLHWMGHLHDDYALTALYSAADVLVIPSRQESFGQIGSEAHACGCPVVAFNATGLRDIVEHGVTGYLAEPYSSDDLAQGIVRILKDDEHRRLLAAHARERAVRLWSPEIVVPQYLDVYRRAMDVKRDVRAIVRS